MKETLMPHARKYKKNPKRISNSFCEDELKVLRYLSDCAIQQKVVPLSVVRAEGFLSLSRKVTNMQRRHDQNIAEVAVEVESTQGLSSEHLG